MLVETTHTEELPTLSMLLRLPGYSLTDDTPESMRRLLHKLVVMTSSDFNCVFHCLCQFVGVSSSVVFVLMYVSFIHSTLFVHLANDTKLFMN